MTVKFFNAHVKCRKVGAIGKSEPMTFFMIRKDGTRPTVEEVIIRVIELGYEHVMVQEIVETTDPSIGAT